MGSFNKTMVITALVTLALVSCNNNKLSSGNNSIEAAVNEDKDCIVDLNLKSDKVYAYRGDAFFLTPSIQAGGHSNDFKMDLGVNLFAPTEALLLPGAYSLNNGGGIPGTAYVYYIPDDDGPDEFISADNQGILQVSRILLEDDGSGTLQVKDFEASFGNVLMISNLTGDTICIGSFDLQVTDAN